MSSHSYFHTASGSPRSLQLNGLFRGSGAAYSYTSGSSDLLQQLMQQINDQGSVLDQLVGSITGKSGGSAVQSVLGGASFGGSALGGIASAAASGFSLKSVLSDIFPLGGLISSIAGLFDSAPTPPPLDQYAAPPSLNFDAVLNANGTLSQGSSNQYGYTRASGQGLNLADAEGGPYSPYTRASNGSLVPAAGDPTTLYSGTLNLPDLLQPLLAPGAAATGQSSSQASGSSAPTTSYPGALNLPALLQTLVTPSATPAAGASSNAASQPASTAASSNNNTTGLNSTGASLTADASNPVPSFDQQWFDDHGSQIASAVRAQLLNFHPIVDAINDL